MIPFRFFTAFIVAYWDEQSKLLKENIKPIPADFCGDGFLQTNEDILLSQWKNKQVYVSW